LRARPPSTLSPYTTLFRSGIALLGTLDDVLSRLQIIQRMLAGLLGMRGPGIVCHGTGGYAEYRDQQEMTNVHATSVAALPASCADRKSTRLNSSHVKISYA